MRCGTADKKPSRNRYQKLYKGLRPPTILGATIRGIPAKEATSAEAMSGPPAKKAASKRRALRREAVAATPSNTRYSSTSGLSASTSLLIALPMTVTLAEG